MRSVERPSKRSMPLRTAIQASCTTSSATLRAPDVAACDGEHRRKEGRRQPPRRHARPVAQTRHEDARRRRATASPPAGPLTVYEASVRRPPGLPRPPISQPPVTNRHAAGDIREYGWVLARPDGTDALRRSQRPVIRLFGPLSIEDGGAASARATSAGRGRSRCSRSCSRRAAIASRSTASPSSSGESDGRKDVAGSLQTFVSILRRHLSLRPGAGARPRRHRAGGVPLRDRARRARPRPLRRAARALRARTDAPRPALARAGTRARARRGPRGRAVRHLGTWTCAAATRAGCSAPTSTLPTRRWRSSTSLAALAHAEAAGTLDRFSERAHRTGDARALRARAPARSARPLPHASARGSTRSSASSRRRRHARSRRRLSGRRTSARCCRDRSPVPRGALPALRPACSAARSELELLERDAREALDGHVRADRDRGRGGARKDAAARRARDELDGRRASGRASCSRARAPPSVRAARGRAPRALAASSSTANACLHSPDPPRAHARDDRPGSSSEVEVLEALVALVAEHAPLVLLLDDLQWADHETIAALGYLRRARAGTRGAIVVTTRDDDACGDHPVRRLHPTRSFVSSRSPRTSSRRSGTRSARIDRRQPALRRRRRSRTAPAPSSRARHSPRRCSRSCRAEGPSGLPRAPRRLDARAAVRAGAARGPPRARRGRPHRRARASL